MAILPRSLAAAGHYIDHTVFHELKRNPPLNEDQISSLTGMSSEANNNEALSVNINCKFFKLFQWDYLKSTLVCASKIDLGGHILLIGLQPASSTETP